MKQMSLDKGDLAACVSQAQQGRVVITRKGKPVALVVGIEGLDREQIELGSSDTFWKLIVKRRKQETLSRAALERKINSRK
jgi:prevent-host-death family protein